METVKDEIQICWADTDAPIFNANLKHLIRQRCHTDAYILTVFSILDGIVQQVRYNLSYLIGIHICYHIRRDSLN